MTLLVPFLLLSVQASIQPRTFNHLSSQQLRDLVGLRDPESAFELKDPASHLSKILIPRAPGTVNHTLVRQHITSTLQNLKWEVEEDAFTDNTPFGERRFTNIIATKDPTAARRVVLAAHYDSKFFQTHPLDQFVGATDSAMPCALLLDVAEVLDPLLTEKRSHHAGELDDLEDPPEDITLQLIFFDGEEAFKDWTATDSIYGARHLAEKWELEYIESHAKRRLHPPPTQLSSIDNLILLDLLGAPNPTIQSYFLSTAWLFDELISVEDRLSSSNLAETTRSFFRRRHAQDHNYGGMGDDHVPFIQRGVSVLHVIANPFPHVWHTLADDASALDMPTMKKWNLLFRTLVAEYLGLQPGSRVEPRSHSSSELVRSVFVETYIP
ncbi:hypothetical protein SISNIDRAFT_488870 [Sistotremastrum niveocremeum HHB9708]|uniref:Peptide hydrolase n=2 Tax=Sistotremastraceae TaxID=3402574 RepID=A0A164QW29_9AGAM|nr:hypothetical protein SISNIDRAFT_488870 [Sistotremastrum niveocremeum HHB9708]KZT39253.1 hypothetical protein SISSUDRAFT_985143 [Sistotremastrum suecicum HHB10207 ss-3]